MVTKETQAQAFHFLGTWETMDGRDTRVQKDHRDFRGQQDQKATLETKAVKVRLGPFSEFKLLISKTINMEILMLTLVLQMDTYSS